MITSVDQVKTAYKKLVKQYGQYVFEIDQLQQDIQRKSEEIVSHKATIGDLSTIIDELRIENFSLQEQLQKALDRLAVYENQVIEEAVEIESQPEEASMDSATNKPTRRNKKKDNDE